jgi:ribosomal protein S18 acetylase RimI-like enzyme
MVLMDLPILKVTNAPTVETLIRYYGQCESNWTAHLAEKTDLEFGTAWVSSWPNVHYANRMMDVALPADVTPEQALQTADAHFSAGGSTCWQWILNPSSPAEQTQPMVDLLMSRGYERNLSDIMYLEHLRASSDLRADESLLIIPARASFRHARELHAEASRKWNEPQCVEAGLAHLDDPHYDALIALENGHAVAHIGVLAIGEIGLIEEVFVVESHRSRGLGTTMMGRAMEICGRSLFKHVLLCVSPTNAPAVALYKRFGFRKIGEWVEYHKP